MASRQTPRAFDERLLAWLDRRAAGESCARIARGFGLTGNAVNHATGLVLAADLAVHDPCADADEIRRAYW